MTTMKGLMFPILTIIFHSTRSNNNNYSSNLLSSSKTKWATSMEMYSIRRHLSMVGVTKTRILSTSQAVQPSSSSTRCSNNINSRSRWFNSNSSSSKNTIWWLQLMKICNTIATLMETTTTTATSLRKTDSPLSLPKLMEEDHSDDT